MKKWIIALFCLCSNMVGLAQISSIQKSAEAGDIDAQKYMAEAYISGNKGVEKNLKKAFEWYLKAARQNDAEAQYEVFNLIFQVSKIVTEDEMEEAINYLPKAADQGYGPAIVQMGNIFANRYNKYVDAFRCYKDAAQRSYPIAFLALGDCYLYGKGTEQNLTEAEHCYQMALEYNLPNAYLGLAYCAEAKKDYAKAKGYYEEAIKHNIPQAYNDMAHLYAYGYGVKKDMSKAFDLVNQAIAYSNSQTESINFLDTKGEFYLLENQIDEAANVWKDIKQINENYAQNNDSHFCKTMRSQIEGSVDLDIAKTNTINLNTYVLIIANENYKHEAMVPYASNDGNIFKEYCHKTLGIPEEHIKLIIDATYNDFRFALNWLNQITSTDNQAKVIFYYAGHGIPDETQKGAYLLPIDGYASDVVTGYSLNELYKDLEILSTQTTTVFLDACFSGTKREGDMLASARGVAIKVNPNMPTGKIVVFSASQGDETAYPYEEKRHGMFTYYLLKKLQETKGDVTLEVLSQYIIEQVRRQSVTLNGKIQTPTVYSSATLGDSWKAWKLK